MHDTLILDIETKVDFGENGKPEKPLNPVYYTDPRIALVGIRTAAFSKGPLSDSPHEFMIASRSAPHKASGGILTDIRILENLLENLDVKWLVGHNIKFDLLHLFSECPEIRRAYHAFVRRGGLVLDTQLLAYLASGGEKKFATLDSLCGGGVKDSFMQEMFDKGECPMTTKDTAKLVKYLRNDLNMTETAMRRLVEVVDPAVMCTQSLALMATIEMEYNGVSVAEEERWNIAEVTLGLREREITDTLRSRACASFGWDASKFGLFEPSKRSHLQYVLQDRHLKGKERKVVGKYKNGKHKTRLEPVEWHKPKTAARPVDMPKSLDADVLKKLTRDPNTAVASFAEELLELRKVAKIRSTYVLPIMEKSLVMGDSTRIYPRFNMGATATGRLSSSNPNFQNLPLSGDILDIRSLIQAPKGKVLIDLDYKQLEIIGLALISQCEALNNALKSGKDIHEMTGRHVFGGKMTKEQRRVVKTVNFGLIYGGGAAVLATQAGISKKLAQECIDAFYSEFKGVKLFFDRVYAQLNDGVQPPPSAPGIFPHIMDIWTEPAAEAPSFDARHIQVRSCTGRLYTFKEYYNPPRYFGDDEGMKLSYTQVRNWFVQGFATGDIVPMMMGVLHRRLIEEELTDKVRLVMQVHDSIVLETSPELTDRVIDILRETVAKVPEHLEAMFGIETDLPFKIDVALTESLSEEDVYQRVDI